MKDTDKQAENHLIADRRAKLDYLRANGECFPNDFKPTVLVQDLRSEYATFNKQELQEQWDNSAKPAKPAKPAKIVQIAGRIMQRRTMGKACFIVVQDSSGRMQCFLRKNELGDVYEEFCSKWDLGDIVGIEGHMMKTDTGELTIRSHKIRLLTKSLRPLPNKHKWLADTETRYRRRYLDLIGDPQSRQRFVARSKIIENVRQWFLGRGYLEVETPVLHPVAGGATARPFVTHHNSLSMDMFLRIAPELYLKRLVVGGFERVFEFSRNFRNEGLSTKHNPEFTMLEFYQAYADYLDLMVITEDIFSQVAKMVVGSTTIHYQGKEIDFAPPFEKLSLLNSIEKYSEYTEQQLDNRASIATIAEKHGIIVEPEWGIGKLQLELFEKLVEHQLLGPVFITDYPAEVSPLSRRNPKIPDQVDRFELFVAGMEIANGFSEINDPEDQADRFRLQMQAKAKGDQEAMAFDEDYVQALEYGMPPTAGEGIGIDRMVMLLTDAASIRDVTLFPHLKPKR